MVFPPRHDLFKQDPSSHLIWTSIDTLMGGAGAGNGGILVPISYTAYLLSYLSQNLLRLTRLLSAPRSLSQSLARRPQGCSIARTVDSSPQVVARPLAVPTNAISEVIEAVPLLGISHSLFLFQGSPISPLALRMNSSSRSQPSALSGGKVRT